MRSRLSLFSLIMLLLSSGAYGQSQKEICRGSGDLAKTFAKIRDNGTPIASFISEIERREQSQGTGEAEIMLVKSLAYSIYSDKRKLSQEEVSSYYYLKCLKDTKR